MISEPSLKDQMTRGRVFGIWLIWSIGIVVVCGIRPKAYGSCSPQDGVTLRAVRPAFACEHIQDLHRGPGAVGPRGLLSKLGRAST